MQARSSERVNESNLTITIVTRAEDTSNPIRAFGLERVRVYGISMGGMIAQ